MLRHVNTGAFEVYDIAGNALTGAAPLGQVGLDWQLGGFAPISPTGSPGSTDAPDSSNAQLVQAIAGFGGGSGAADGLNAGGVDADATQQPLLTTPQHA